MMDDFRPKPPVRQKPEAQITALESTFTPHGAGPITAGHHEPLLLPERVLPHHKVKHWYLSLSRRQQIITLAVTSVVLIGVAVGGFMTLRPKNELYSVSSTGKKAAAGAPITTVPSLLTGLPVDAATNQQQVIGAMIENSTDARPQSGLDKAGVIFEAIAEGGITRFLALYQDSTTDYLGPVRSARPYYVQWCQGFDCGYAHVGGSPEALQNIKDWNIKDLNQFYGGSYFQRISSRKAPHNVYTSTSQLAAFASSKGYHSSTYTGFARLSKEPKIDSAKVTLHAINIDYPGTAFDVHYDYDAASNSFKRSEGGAPHLVVDANATSVQLAPKVVIAMAVGRTLQSDNKHNTYNVVGSGEAVVFQNGVATHGSWSKASGAAQIEFKDDSGKILALTPGQTWISAVDSLGNANYN